MPFKISSDFVKQYSTRDPKFGFNGLGYLVYMRTYSRLVEKRDPVTGVLKQVNEQWFETVERVVNGTYDIMKNWIKTHGLHWNDTKAQKSAQKMYKLIFEMKFLPPGRGLWSMGSPLTLERKLFAALNNCAFVSTDKLDQEPTKPYTFLMDASMLGVGVGFDTKGAGKVMVLDPAENKKPQDTFLIPDSREGWVEAVRLTLQEYFVKDSKCPKFDFSAIRAAGTPIKGFGGIASGPAALVDLLFNLRTCLNKNVGKTITVTTIVDIMNLIGKCVIAGNVRRTAEIAFGAPDSDEFRNLKNYQLNPDRSAFGWASNNSIFAELGMDYSKVAESIQLNGEPGFAWLSNMKQFSRMDGSKSRDDKDFRVAGGNPCLEQSLESFELCCLVETFPTNHDSMEEYIETLKYAYLYAKVVTLGQTHWPETNQVMRRNRRIGCSVSGIAQFITKHGHETLRQWLTKGYESIVERDLIYSEWLGVMNSVKMTSVKPSGTVSLLAGSTPGMHYPESRFYIRRMRLSSTSNLLNFVKRVGYPTEPAADAPNDTVVVEVPIDSGKGIRTLSQVTMWEQLQLAQFMQRYWADNQVSCTVTFDPASEGSQIEHALNFAQYNLKGISFLPRLAKGAYKQMPYEEISETEYQMRVSKLKLNQKIDQVIGEKAVPERFCDTTSCAI